MARNVQVDQSRREQDYYTEREWRRIQQRERAERRRLRLLGLLLAGMVLLVALLSFAVYVIVFRSHDYTLKSPFVLSEQMYGSGLFTGSGDRADGFASGLCVTARDVNISQADLGAYEAALFDLNKKEVLYAKDIFTPRSPASMTKIMTALVALKYGNPDDMVTVTETALDIEYGSSVCDIKVGDRLSLKQLLYGLMVASGNDAAMMIAEHVGGTVADFVALMNKEALSLGATDTHFANPHGLTDPAHYTSAYDMYLIFNEAMKYDMFMDMIARSNYYAEYTRGDGSAVAVTWESTDHYLTGEAGAPGNVIIYGGKTGTTDDAGACLTLLSKDLYGNPFVSVIMHAADKETLYTEMNDLLGLVPN